MRARVACLFLIPFFSALSGLAQGEYPVPTDARQLIEFTTPFSSTDGDWIGKVKIEAGKAVISGCKNTGSVGYSAALDLSQNGDDCLAILVEAGPKNTANNLRVKITDQDKRECVWVFSLPKPGEGAKLVNANDGASLLLPNKPDPRDFGFNDLRRITAVHLMGSPDDNGAIDVTVSAILAVKPDAAALKARELMAEKLKKEQGWAKARDDIAKKYVAQFPELNVAVPSPIPGKQIVRAYHIGNSLTFKALSYPFKTWSINAYEERILAFMEGRGVKYIPGWHISWGASLPSIWNNRFQPAVGNAGSAGKALVDHTWDVLTLQLWGADVEGDVASSTNFIAMGVAKNPNLQVYLVETWVHKEKTLTPDFPTQWNRGWKVDQKYGIPPIHCKAYSSLVFRRLQKATAGLRHPVRLIPIGSVLYELDKRMRAGEVHGFTRVEELYQDEVHLAEAGNYVALETFYTVILGKNPAGRPRTDLFPTVTDAFAAVVQDTIWKVVTSMPETGISNPSDQENRK